ncbi:MAG: adenosylcobinamide-GDP ribazoletransferase [Chloroherpetonaceae bacterium]|nr:adenosylcobinamide-GDP ribazoletransferase [Chloroherpetonaceae bacterium]
MMFLTRVPVGRWVRYSPTFLAQSTLYFPLVGLLVGAFGALILWASARLLPVPQAVLLSMLATVLATGAFHEDGLADSADGFGGASERTRILEIMRDSRIGTFGALALWFALTAKFLFISELASQSIQTAMLAMVVAHTAGRWSSLWLIRRLEYVRTESATAKPFAGSVTPSRFWLATAIFGFATLLCFAATGLFLLTTAIFVSYLAERFLHQRIGGITGDTLGAVNQVTEISLYFSLEALMRLQTSLLNGTFLGAPH